ncbi:MAG: hypothetical protein WCL51_12840 [Bacteroidota bacterium]
MNFDDFEYNEKNWPKDYADRHIYFDELKKAFLEEIKSSKENKDYLKKYNVESVESFMLRYAERKSYLIEHYKSELARIRSVDLRVKKEAEGYFDYIKQKQLYNLQLKWRAEEIKLEGVKSCGDFEFWGKHINDCFFLPQISEYEVKLLKDYLKSEDYRPEGSFSRLAWQSHDMFNNNLIPFFNIEYPAWYKYYDAHLGTGSLLNLPNIRGNKEYHYLYERSSNENKEQKKIEKAHKKNPPPPLPQKPIKLTDDIYGNIDLFIQEFEKDQHILELERLFKKQTLSHNYREKVKAVGNETYNEHGIDDEVVEEAVRDLDAYETKIPILGGFQWREAILVTLENYKIQRIEELIDGVYDEYLMLEETGITTKRPKEIMLAELEANSHIALQRRLVLDGRELLGEPRDFNF